MQASGICASVTKRAFPRERVQIEKYGTRILAIIANFLCFGSFESEFDSRETWKCDRSDNRCRISNVAKIAMASRDAEEMNAAVSFGESRRPNDRKAKIMAATDMKTDL